MISAINEISVSAVLWLVGGWALVTAVTLVAVGLVLLLLPPTYLQTTPMRHHSGSRLSAATLARNALGILLVVGGAVLALPGIPGQGVLTMLIGLVLLDIPGCRRLGQRMIGRPGVLAGINRLRARFGRPPLLAPH